MTVKSLEDVPRVDRRRAWRPLALTYLAFAVVVALLGGRSPAAILGVPLIVLSGLALVGHLVTLDDDAAGGWSNPGGSRRVLRQSLVRLAVEGAVFAVATRATLHFLD